MAAAHRLTERDRIILTMLYRHRVFTTDQLAEMYFDNLNTAQHRLTTLYKLRLLDRFQPLDHRHASLPYHYVLNQLGATVVAGERGEDPDTSRWRADKALAIGKSQRLGHLIGVNGFFSALLAESRRREDCDLSLWWSERHCASQFERIDQPDGLGILLRPPAPGGRRTQDPGQSHRPGGDDRSGADPAAAGRHLGADRRRGPPAAPCRAGRRAHPGRVLGAHRRDPGVPAPDRRAAIGRVGRLTAQLVRVVQPGGMTRL